MYTSTESTGKWLAVASAVSQSATLLAGLTSQGAALNRAIDNMGPRSIPSSVELGEHTINEAIRSPPTVPAMAALLDMQIVPKSRVPCTE